MFKRSNVSSPLNCTLDELLKLKREFAESALSRPSKKTAFDYGWACGFYQAIGQAIATIEKNLNEGTPNRDSREET